MLAHRVSGAPLDFAALRSELTVPGGFTAAALDEAARASKAVVLPDEDATDITFVTVDPPGSRDLDQAVYLERSADGYLVRYAIADVGAFVQPGASVDAEAHSRGQTLYFPDARVPLHPPSLGEDAASLLPGRVRPAVLWRIELDSRAAVIGVDVSRARVRSVAALNYLGLQKTLADGTAPAAVALLPEIGALRLARARERHAINLDLPEQSVQADPAGGWTLRLREQLPVEQYNAEISLLTGMCAARLMLDAGIGILRTVPPPQPGAVRALHRAARALGVAWPERAEPGDVLAGVERSDPRHVAFLEHAVALLRGAGYEAFDGTVPPQPLHAGIGAPYAHVTAPLRRLVDRYASEICLALQAKQAIPGWVREALPALPEQMRHSDQRAHEVDRAVVDATEAWLLRDRIGATFAAVVIDAEEHAGTVVLDEPPVRARCDGHRLPVGHRLTVRLTAADVATRTVRFEVA